MAEKREFKNKQKCQKSLKREKLHSWKLPLSQYLVMIQITQCPIISENNGGNKTLVKIVLLNGPVSLLFVQIVSTK